MKVDVYGHKNRYENWKKEVLESGEEGLSMENSDLLVRYILDMEIGANVSKGSRKGPRQPSRLNNLRQRLTQIMKMLQERGFNDLSKLQRKYFWDLEQTLAKIWTGMAKGDIKTYKGEPYKSVDTYQGIFSAFWHWWMKVNRKKQKSLPDITEDWGSQSSQPVFVWFTKEELEKMLPYFSKEDQTVLLFMFDSIVRAPTELLSLRVHDIFQEGDEVWVKVREEISKTFERVFNLAYSGSAILEYVKRNELNPNDYLFKFSPPIMIRKLQKVAEQVFGNRMSKAGEYYKKMTLYDFRHSGTIHFRPRVSNPDKLRHRGGWSGLKMVNYYTKLLGMTGKIERGELLVEEDKTRLETEVIQLRTELESMRKVERDLELMKKHFPVIRDVLQKASSVEELEAAYQKKTAA